MCRRPSCRRDEFERRRHRRSSICWRACRLAPSKSEARRLVQSGGVYVNNRRVSDPQARLTRDAGDRRPAVRAAEGAEAESSRAADLTAFGDGTRYSLNVRSDVTRCMGSGDLLRLLSRFFRPTKSSSVLHRHPARLYRLETAANFGLTEVRKWLVTLEGSPKRGRLRQLGRRGAAGIAARRAQGVTGRQSVL